MLHFLLEIIIMTRSTKTRLLLRDKCKVVHSDRLYRPMSTNLEMENNKNIKKTVSLILSPLSPWAVTEVFVRRGMQTQTTKIPPPQKKALNMEKKVSIGEKKPPT